MKSINFRQKILYFCFLLIVLCTFSKANAQTIEVISQDNFSTEKPPTSISVMILDTLQISEKDTLKAGTIVKGDLTDVVSPKRLKRDAGFSFIPKSYIDEKGKSKKINSHITAKYTEPVSKAELAKNVTLGVGSYFVKGLSMGVAAVSGAIKNEDDNRLKSSAGAMYEASPFSLVKKGDDLYIEKNNHFFLKFSPPTTEESNDSNVFNGQNYSYTTEKE